MKFGRMTKCQRELLLDQAESYRNEMEKKHKGMISSLFSDLIKKIPTLDFEDLGLTLKNSFFLN